MNMAACALNLLRMTDLCRRRILRRRGRGITAVFHARAKEPAFQFGARITRR